MRAVATSRQILIDGLSNNKGQGKTEHLYKPLAAGQSWCFPTIDRRRLYQERVALFWRSLRHVEANQSRQWNNVGVGIVLARDRSGVPRWVGSEVQSWPLVMGGSVKN